MSFVRLLTRFEDGEQTICQLFGRIIQSQTIERPPWCNSRVESAQLFRHLQPFFSAKGEKGGERMMKSQIKQVVDKNWSKKGPRGLSEPPGGLCEPPGELVLVESWLLWYIHSWNHWGGIRLEAGESPSLFFKSSTSCSSSFPLLQKGIKSTLITRSQDDLPSTMN